MKESKKHKARLVELEERLQFQSTLQLSGEAWSLAAQISILSGFR